MMLTPAFDKKLAGKTSAFKKHADAQNKELAEQKKQHGLIVSHRRTQGKAPHTAPAYKDAQHKELHQTQTLCASDEPTTSSYPLLITA